VIDDDIGKRKLVETDPGEHEKNERHSEAFVKHVSEWRRQNLSDGGEGGFQHGGSD
jgi:hypothetical protein